MRIRKNINDSMTVKRGAENIMVRASPRGKNARHLEQRRHHSSCNGIESKYLWKVYLYDKYSVMLLRNACAATKIQVEKVAGDRLVPLITAMSPMRFT